jgi:hypothetical protein
MLCCRLFFALFHRFFFAILAFVVDGDGAGSQHIWWRGVNKKFSSLFAE